MKRYAELQRFPGNRQATLERVRTQEPLDPVRYITNRSSGKMGYALAAAAVARGARVILVSGPVSLEAPQGAEMIHVRTALEMRKAVMEDFVPQQ